MAHENHRFNLILRNHNHPTSKSQASLNPIFSEASHGTHYTLFAEFLPKDSNKVYEGSFEVGSIRVKLQNFTGPITMGISEIIGINIYNGEESMKEFMVENFSTKRVVELIVSVQPLNSCQEKTIELDNSLSLTLNEGDIFETQVMKKLIDQEYSGAGRTRFENQALILDENHMYRDGEEIVITNDDMWKDKSTLLMLESAGFIINDQINNTLKYNNTSIEKSLENTKQLAEITLGISSNKSRRNDPKCKQKTSDIYIM
ncbi:hypothetical protein [Patiriisocius marinus]|uniref:Uncharacterized protein n=1 Tax=Patiriisocius marinus TaxID=1397112 RepID=A0A5J4IXT1_9FLAO|nr:hypothetical protein [Patiriisocius marinus]GER59756.1 hypothetical protein ULMA_18640 [Patiriisocius marinus]